MHDSKESESHLQWPGIACIAKDAGACGPQNDSLATLLARLEGILRPVPRRMLRDSRFAHRYYTRSGAVFERSSRSVSHVLDGGPLSALESAQQECSAPRIMPSVLSQPCTASAISLC